MGEWSPTVAFWVGVELGIWLRIWLGLGVGRWIKIGIPTMSARPVD